MNALKTILSFTIGGVFGILMTLSYAQGQHIAAVVCGVISVILLVACGVLIGENNNENL